MSILFASLYHVTAQHKEPLCLSEQEEAVTRGHVRAWLVCAAMAVLSLLLANFTEGVMVTAAGWAYAFIYPTIVVVDRFLAR